MAERKNVFDPNCSLADVSWMGLALDCDDVGRFQYYFICFPTQLLPDQYLVSRKHPLFLSSRLLSISTRERFCTQRPSDQGRGHRCLPLLPTRYMSSFLSRKGFSVPTLAAFLCWSIFIDFFLLTHCRVFCSSFFSPNTRRLNACF